MELTSQHIGLLKHLAEGGMISCRIYGKRTKTIDLSCKPRCSHVGLLALDTIRRAGLIHEGDPSPYKDGKIWPYVLTDLGRQELQTASASTD